MGHLSDFQRRRLAGAYVTKMATLLGASRPTASNIMMAYTKMGIHHQLRGLVAENENSAEGIAVH